MGYTMYEFHSRIERRLYKLFVIGRVKSLENNSRHVGAQGALETGRGRVLFWLEMIGGWGTKVREGFLESDLWMGPKLCICRFQARTGTQWDLGKCWSCGRLWCFTNDQIANQTQGGSMTQHLRTTIKSQETSQTLSANIFRSPTT